MERRGWPSGDRRCVLPPAYMRLLAMLLIVGLMSLSAYVGCRQLHGSPAGGDPPDRIEAVDAIHAYIQRVENALISVDDALFPDEPCRDR